MTCDPTDLLPPLPGNQDERRWTIHGVVDEDGNPALMVKGPPIDAYSHVEVCSVEALEFERQWARGLYPRTDAGC